MLVFGVTIVGGFASLIYAWHRSRGQASEQKLTPWRRLAARCGLYLAASQGALLAAFWAYNMVIGGWSNDYLLFRRWARTEFALFFLAVPCLLVGEAKYRLWALVSSGLLFLICLVVTISM